MTHSENLETSLRRVEGPAVAIVGSGPAGCYLAQHLLKLLPTARIAIFERLPVPYGLIRYGVAPDHQGTKSVTRQFDRLFELGQIQFAGNIDVGIDVSLEQLRDAFDVVALAAGVHADRQLHVVGEDLRGVYRAGKMLRMLNGHPDEPWADVSLGSRAVIIGNGNVALDVLRLLIKDVGDFEASDIDNDVFARLETDRLKEVEILGRSAAGAAKFDAANIRELSKVKGVRFLVVGLDDRELEGSATAAPKLAALKGLEAREDGEPIRATVTFRFGWSPLSIEGADQVQGILFNKSDDSDEVLKLSADSVITAVGFAKPPQGERTIMPLPSLEGEAETGRIGEGLFCTGWYRRGAQGTIPENRTDARQVAELIATSLAAKELRAERPGLRGLPANIIDKAVSFTGWRAIDAAETGNAPPGRVRRKIRTWCALLATAYDGKITEEVKR
ncbi:MULTISPECIES: oxidoreductase [unclassified Mesorhizobium]|uniref:oxidoreductase n=1 Tax=unclassified Mesorhizobium TaxID=325217 RepID=UPI000FD71299|nr:MULTISPECIES: oxidoreductase [unclassified Mesorhizobium]TGR23006.1 oxidoreductase [Mesorhizobium sp. M8A.F.Ca.ET.197.01.1.1]TGR39091.1 oxidoreductase [bacterium M00.F.Ca.ET.199.01.1.1]TGR46685.1 oxidoreductase [Mesorhizobium sp. M8A.F.Ca.ET.198.01.1.1]TGV85241.1 oxidoreductase [Mesorhizobium sp. M00.F.Ca.ET.149.01.1.1]